MKLSELKQLIKKEVKKSLEEGWWTLNPTTGGVGEKPKIATSTEFRNAVPGRDNKTGEMFGGDGPADIMGNAIDKIIKEYENVWKRKPYLEEVKGVFDFVFNALDRTRDLEKYKR